MSGIQAKKVLYETISRDQFLGYMTEDIKVATLSKQLYRYFTINPYTVKYALKFDANVDFNLLGN